MSKRQAKHVPPTGELRQSQLLTTFGPGSMVDLPNHAVLIGGLDHWQFAERKRIYEDRLERRLCDLLALEELTLYEPPVDNDDPTAPRSGVTVFLFPAWFLAQVEETYKAPDPRRPRVPSPPADPVGPTREGWLPESRPQDRPGRADSVRPSLCEGAHQRHRLVRLRPRDVHT